jgi:hypothetical protein
LGEYLPIEYGTLQVLLSGGNNQGRWSIDNGTTWHISNDTLHLPTNNFYYVTYKTVSGWIVPNYASYHPIANQTTLLVGNYYLTEYGILKVNIVGGGGQGQWSPNNGTTWYNSGDTARLSTNTYYYITFKTVSGWITPPYIYHQPVANQTAIVTGTYTTPQYGILKVNIIGGGGQGQWSADNGATWHNSGDTLHLATNNSYYIYFKNVAGYNTPYYQYYTPVTNQTTTLTGTYTVMPYATLKVNLTGASGQGLWSLDQLVWHASGDTLHLYDTYTYIYFKPVAGWIKPIVQSVNLYANQTTTTVGTYSMHVGTEVNSPQFDFAIMPNPANDYLRCVSSSNETVTPLELRLFNTLGILVYQTSLSANDDQRLDTSTYPAGFYFLQLYDPRSKAFVIHKVIIEH